MNDEELAGININEPVLEIHHSELERFSKTSIYKSVCPVCEQGLLLIYRNQKTLKLEEYDRCVLCGQLIRYLDIELLRKREGG